jgi:hypothetical protein
MQITPNLMAIPIAALLLMQLAAAGPLVGVASITAAGDGCVAMPAPPLAPGSAVTLVQPDSPQAVLAATIEQRVTSCADLEGGMISGPYYRVRQISWTPSESGTLWVAFRGKVNARKTASGEIVLRFSVTYPNIQIRSCTSYEGLHLTVWTGAPLRSRRLWHEYYYLGFDVEPSCEDEDTRVTAGFGGHPSMASSLARRPFRLPPEEKYGFLLRVFVASWSAVWGTWRIVAERMKPEDPKAR